MDLGKLFGSAELGGLNALPALNSDPLELVAVVAGSPFRPGPLGYSLGLFCSGLTRDEPTSILV